jgi:hypothetical protein
LSGDEAAVLAETPLGPFAHTIFQFIIILFSRRPPSLGRMTPVIALAEAKTDHCAGEAF